MISRCGLDRWKDEWKDGWMGGCKKRSFLLSTLLNSSALCGVSIFHCCDKISDINSLREESFILAHGFRHFSARLAGLVALGLW